MLPADAADVAAFPISFTIPIAANVSPRLSACFSPNMFFTIFSAVHIKDIHIIDKNIFANDGPVLNKSNVVDTNTKYITTWNGWIKTLNINSLIHVFNACAWPSFILSIE